MPPRRRAAESAPSQPAAKRSKPEVNIPSLNWRGNEWNLGNRALSVIEEPKYCKVLFGTDKGEKTVGTSKATVYRECARKLWPEVPEAEITVYAGRLKLWVDSMKTEYKKFAKRLTVTGGGQGGNDESSDDEDLSERMYIPSTGPDEHSSPAAVNLWAAIADEFPLFPRLHKILATKPNYIPIATTTGVGPSGRQTVYMQPRSPRKGRRRQGRSRSPTRARSATREPGGPGSRPSSPISDAVRRQEAEAALIEQLQQTLGPEFARELDKAPDGSLADILARAAVNFAAAERGDVAEAGEHHRAGSGDAGLEGADAFLDFDWRMPDERGTMGRDDGPHGEGVHPQEDADGGGNAGADGRLSGRANARANVDAAAEDGHAPKTPARSSTAQVQSSSKSRPPRSSAGISSVLKSSSSGRRESKTLEDRMIDMQKENMRFQLQCEARKDRREEERARREEARWLREQIRTERQDLNDERKLGFITKEEWAERGRELDEQLAASKRPRAPSPDWDEQRMQADEEEDL